MGQEESAESAGSAKLEINLDAHGGAKVALKIPERSTASPLAPVLNQVIGCRFENPKDRDVEGDWVFAGRCAGAFRKRGLLVGGQIQFTPLMEVLKEASVEK